MLDPLFKQGQKSYHSSILSSIHFVDVALRGLVAKSRRNQSQGSEATLLKGLHSCLVSRHRWGEGRCLTLKTSTLRPNDGAIERKGLRLLAFTFLKR